METELYLITLPYLREVNLKPVLNLGGYRIPHLWLNVIMAIRIKRIYESYSADDGFRVLVDRLWPRGVSKQKAHLNLWLKEIGPSDELRKWFNHDPAKYAEFKRRYIKELGSNPAAEELRDIIKKHGKVTLLYSAHDEQHNQATVLQEYLTS